MLTYSYLMFILSLVPGEKDCMISLIPGYNDYYEEQECC